MKKVIYILVFIFFQNGFSQIYETGLTLNLPNILSENTGTLDLIKPSISPTNVGAIIKKNVNPRIAYRASLNKLTDKGTTILEGTLGVDINFKKYNLLRYRKGERGTPYFIIEAAALWYNNSEDKLSGPTVALPVGIGYKRAINRRWIISVEGKGRVALTDSLSKNKIGSENSSTLDSYYFFSGSLYYTFGWPKHYKSRSKF
ncbi:hypothetical protein [Wenyingzhuangia sp. IMCC45574]